MSERRLSIPLIRISCALGSGTGIVTNEKSLTLLYRIAFISFGTSYFAGAPVCGKHCGLGDSNLVAGEMRVADG